MIGYSAAKSVSIPVPDNLTVAAELQAIALAIRMFGMVDLDKVIVRQPLSNPQQLEASHETD